MTTSNQGGGPPHPEDKGARPADPAPPEHLDAEARARLAEAEAAKHAPPPAPAPAGAPEQHPGDSAIDFDLPGGQAIDLSGVSVIEWAALVEEPRSQVGSSKPKFDSPSDVDLLRKTAPAEQPPPHPEAPAAAPAPFVPAVVEVPPLSARAPATGLDLTAHEPSHPADASIDLGARPFEGGELGAGPGSAEFVGDSSIDLAVPPPAFVAPEAPPSVGSGVDLLAADAIDLGPRSDVVKASAASGDSGIDWFGAPPIATGAGDSGIDLFGADVVEDVSAARMPPPVVGESGIDLVTEDLIEDVPAVRPLAPPAKDDSAIDLGGADVVFVEESSGLKGPGSAARSESGIDLVTEDLIEDVPAVRPPAPVAAGDSGIALFGADVLEDVPAVRPPGPVAKDESSVELLAADVVEDLPAFKPPTPSAKDDSAIDLLGSRPDAVEDLPLVKAGPPPGDSGLELLGADVFENEPAVKPPAVPKANGDSGLDLMEADASLEVSGKAPTSEGSRRDLIAEAVESGKDLLEAKGKADESGIDLGAEGAIDDQSSSVDLGALPLEPVSPPGRGGSTKDVHGSPAGDSGIDLGASGVLFQGSSRHKGEIEVSPSGIVLNEDEMAAALAGGAAGPGSKAPKKDKEEIDLGNVGIGTGGSGVLIGEEALAGSSIGIGGSGVLIGEEALVGSSVGGALAREEVLEVEEPKKGKKARPPARDQLDEDEAPPPPPRERPVKQKSRFVAFVAGGFLATLVAVGGCFALWLFDVVPTNEHLQMVGLEAPKGAGGGKKTSPGTIEPGAMTFEQKRELLQSGDFEKAKAAGIESADESKPEEVIARADYRWGAYLQEQAKKSARPKLDDPVVKQILTDLEKQGKNADALFLRGQIYEEVGNVPGALLVYQEGLALATDPAKKGNFEAALDRLASEEPAPRRGAFAPALGPDRELAMKAALVWLTTMQVAPGGAPAPAEAGSAFWKATKEIKAGNYEKAIEALEEAKKRHEARRLLLRRKPQNPGSDPNELIFLKACEEILAGWKAQQKLAEPGKYLKGTREERLGAVTDPREKRQLETVEKVLAEAEKRAEASLVQALAKELGGDKAPADAKELVKLLKDQRKTIADQIADLKTTVKEKEDDVAKLTTTVKDKTKESDDLKVKLGATEKKLGDLTVAHNAAIKALVTVARETDVDFADPKRDTPALVKKVKAAVATAKIVDPKGTILKLQADLGKTEEKLSAERVEAKRRLDRRWTSEQMLGYWVPLLQQDRGNPDLPAKAVLDVERVTTEEGATDLQKAKAALVQGLALRNEGKLEQARPALEKAKVGLADLRGPWLPATEDALKEVSGPVGYYAEKVDPLLERGQSAEALVLIDRALALAPEKAGRLRAKRALLLLEAARAKGPLNAANPAVVAARKEADQAVKEKVAEGHYAVGRIAEELGQWPVALGAYKAAIDAAAPADRQLARYKIARARALLRSKAAPGEVALPKRPRDLKSLEMVVLLTVLFQGEVVGEPTKEQQEAEKLAREVLKDEKASFDVRAQALAVLGLHTRALMVFAAGLRDQGVLGAVYANQLFDLVNKNPALKRPESRNVPDPLAGERHYSSGLNFFASRNYADAEKELLSAVENDNADARYYYFLGLSRLAQRKRSLAVEDFDAGARLERLGRPERATVSAALERVQGPMREVLNDVRKRPSREAAKGKER